MQNVSSSSLSQAILSSNTLTAKSQEYDVLRNWLGDGLLLSSGQFELLTYLPVIFS